MGVCHPFLCCYASSAESCSYIFWKHPLSFFSLYRLVTFLFHVVVNLVAVVGAVQIAVCHVGVTWNAMVLLLDVGCVRMARVRKETSAVKTVQIITIVVEYAQNVILMRRNVLQAVIVEMRVQSIPTALKNPLHVTFAQMESAPLKCRFGIFHRQS